MTALAAAPLPFLLLVRRLARHSTPHCWRRRACMVRCRVWCSVASSCHCCCRRPWHPPCWCSCRPSACSASPPCWACLQAFHVATTEIYQLLESYPPRIADATAWGLLLLAITAAADVRSVGGAGASVVRHRHRQGVPSSIRIRRGRSRLRAGCAWLYVALATVLPLIALLWAASSAFVTADRRLMRFSAQHFAYVLFAYPKTWIAAGNSDAARHPDRQRWSPCSAWPSSWIVLRATPSRAARCSTSSAWCRSACRRWCSRSDYLWVYVHLPLPIYGTLGHSADRLCDPLPAVRRARHRRRAASAASGTRGSRAGRRRVLVRAPCGGSPCR